MVVNDYVRKMHVISALSSTKPSTKPLRIPKRIIPMHLQKKKTFLLLKVWSEPTTDLVRCDRKLIDCFQCWQYARETGGNNTKKCPFRFDLNTHRNEFLPIIIIVLRISNL